MPFVKGDPNINRKGRPKNAEAEALREALKKEGLKRGQDFWEKVAEYAFTNKLVMVAVVKKFVPDMSMTEVSGSLSVTEMPIVKVGEDEINPDIGQPVNDNNPSSDS